MRGAASFTLSGLFHGLVLLWLAFGPPLDRGEQPQSAYDLQIRPHEKHIVWYRVRDRLPDISPAPSRQTARTPSPRPPRARHKFTQTMVAGPKDDPRPTPLIQAPTPEVAAPKLPPLPNLVSVAQTPKPVRPFARPPEAKPAAPHTPALPDAPKPADRALDAAAALATANAAPVRNFRAPAAAPRTDVPALPLLPDAPQVTAKIDARLPVLPEGELHAPVRSLAALAPPPTGASAGPSALEDAPAMTAALSPAEASLAIASLNPSKSPEPPAPPASHAAGFSGGPKPRPDGAATAPSTGAGIVVPGLLTRDGAKDQQPSLIARVTPSSRNLMAGLRDAPPAPDTVTPDSAGPRATRVSAAPDPALAGRLVYSIAIQMPNITSYSGSWMVWFADRGPDSKVPGNVRPPVPLRKVDPRYVAAAADERVEGIVRLSAVIRKTGSVENVQVLRHLDDRLDRSAQEALAKWLFEPALRDGAPMEVDAVFEVPFRLLPKPAK